jgi:mannose-1-phosphate guanylyltransferase/mannose-6-phosphate isomerase
MSGGSGTRLWPLSTEERPKQFHALGSDLSMIQATALRVASHKTIDFLPPLVICSHRHSELVGEQFRALGVKPSGVILEPFGRNTASVAVVAAAWAIKHAPDALVLLLPADHVVLDSAAFGEAIEAGVAAAEDHIVTFGIEPEGPETGYGYIQRGERLYPGAFKVARFVEKPIASVAEAYVEDGGYSWNAGIFLYDPRLFLQEARRLAPEIARLASDALETGSSQGAFTQLNDAAFAACPSVPIDIAVMEKTDRAAVVPCSVGWADVGSWSELWRQGPHDAQKNLIHGDVLALGTEGSLIWSDGPKIAVLGLTDLIVIATRDHVMVLPKSRAQEVKGVVDAVHRAAGP